MNIQESKELAINAANAAKSVSVFFDDADNKRIFTEAIASAEEWISGNRQAGIRLNEMKKDLETQTATEALMAQVTQMGESSHDQKMNQVRAWAYGSVKWLCVCIVNADAANIEDSIAAAKKSVRCAQNCLEIRDLIN